MSGPHVPPWILVKSLGLTISIPRLLSTVECVSKWTNSPSVLSIHHPWPITYLQSGKFIVSYWFSNLVIDLKVNNYRPISLLCIISKVLEWIVYNHTIGFLFISTNLVFYQVILACSNYLSLLTSYFRPKDTRRVADVIHLDIRKAFDTYHIINC